MDNSLIRWMATYSDGTTYSNQEEEKSSEHIDRSKLKTFSLIDISGNVIVEQLFKIGDLFQYRCRNIQRIGSMPIRIHIIVLKRNEYRHVIFVNEEDMKVQIGDFSDKGSNSDLYKYPIIELDSDKIPINIS